MKRTIRTIVFAAVAFTGVGVAGAYFTSTGTGTAAAGVGELTAPAAPTVPGTVSGTTVPVSWTGVAAPEGAASVAYWVRRHAGATATDVCGSSLASPILPGDGARSCDDTGVASGTYTYSVTAVWRSWTAASPASAPVSVNADAAGPTIDVTFPAAGAAYRGATWDSGCSSSICGTAADSSGVTGVQVSLRQGSGNYWNGSSFSSADEVLVTATGTTTWSLPFPASSFPADGSYTARVVATDTPANTSSVSRAFVYDATAPTGAVTAPTAGASVRQTVAVASDSADATSGVASARFERSAAGAGSWTTIGTDTSSPYSVNLDTTVLAAGNHDLRVVTTDVAGNAFTSPAVTVTVDNTAPAPTLTSPASGDTVRTTTPALSGAAGNAGGDSANVTVLIYPGTGTGGTPVQTKTATRSGSSWSTTADALATGTYTAQATQTDSAGNTGTSAASTFTVPPFAPTNVVLANNSGTAGTASRDDTVAITFSRNVQVSSLCSSWSGGDTSNPSETGNNAVVVTITEAGGNDVLTVTMNGCTFNLGSIALGADYVSATTTFSGSGANASELAWNAAGRTLTITLGAASSTPNIKTVAAAGTPVYTPSADILDTNLNVISTTAFTAPGPSRF
ncbi:MAG TPA: Ig-like domain-containing protein [Acidimicrobiales bacterium]|jgi:hypothetical protein|nr:Ig-like domain-containing protein [Acidimicrobiales bacterium]